MPQQVLDRLFAAVGSRSMFLSVMSIWKVGLLDAKGRLGLNLPCLAWVRTAPEKSGAQTAPLTPEVAIESNRLPGRFHDDPVDRASWLRRRASKI